LAIDPHNIDALNDKGVALFILGLQSQSQPNDVIALGGKGKALQHFRN
jgi:hypothetical protein